MRLLAATLLSASLLVLAACGKADAPGGGTSGAPGKTVGVSLLNQTNDFFKDIEDGLRSEAAKSGYTLIVQSAEGDAATQTRQIEDFVTRKVAAIVLCPCDSDTVAAGLRGAAAAKVPVFTADIGAKGADIVSHVASDNVQGGRLAGEAMAKFLGGKGKVLIIDHPSVSSVQDRTKGFADAIAKHPGIEIVGRPSAEGQRTKAQSVMEDALTRHPDLAGVFAINDVSALGALRAIEASGRQGLTVIGYDATPEAQDAIRRGSALKASVQQFPKDIGAKTMAAVAKHLAGEGVPKVTPVDVGVVDAESLAKSGTTPK